MLTVHKDSHTHDLPASVLAFVLDKFKDRAAFFIETIELPDGLPLILCALHGPRMWDEPLDESQCFWGKRPSRDYPSRLCNRRPRLVRTITVIAGPHNGEACVLYTAFGGPPSPKELRDPTLKPDEWEESFAFWRDHALSSEESSSD